MITLVILHPKAGALSPGGGVLRVHFEQQSHRFVKNCDSVETRRPSGVFRVHFEQQSHRLHQNDDSFNVKHVSSGLNSLLLT